MKYGFGGAGIASSLSRALVNGALSRYVLVPSPTTYGAGYFFPSFANDLLSAVAAALGSRGQRLGRRDVGRGGRRWRLLAQHDQRRRALDQHVAAGTKKLVDECLHAGEVIRVVVERHQRGIRQECFEVTEVAHDAAVVVQTVDEQEADRFGPRHVGRPGLDCLDERVQTGARQVVAKRLESRAFA